MILVFLCFENLLVTAGLSRSSLLNNLELRISSKKLLKSKTYYECKIFLKICKTLLKICPLLLKMCKIS
jgi:hypothetical protein